jgi:dihydroorotase
MSMNLHIKNGRVIDPANGIDAVQDLFIADGKVAAVGAAPQGFTAARTIDAAGLVVACASRATNTRPRWNRKCAPRCRAA